MNISNFSVNSEQTEISITIDDAANVSELFLFTEDTYKNYSLARDLSSYLTGATTEIITISTIDLDIKVFDGIYYLEATSPTEISSAFLYALSRYEECILNKILKINLCDDCLKNKSLQLINAQTTLEGLKIALQNGFIIEGINLLNNLKNYCSNKCKSCGEYDNLINTTYLSYNDQ